MHKVITIIKNRGTAIPINLNSLNFFILFMKFEAILSKMQNISAN
jgi:hypothetical protein